MIRFDKSSLKNFSNLINNYHCHYYHRLNHRFYKFPLIQSNNPSSSIIILLSSNKKRSYTSIQTFFKPSSKKEQQQQQEEEKPLLAPDKLFHPLSKSPIKEIKQKSKLIHQHG